MKRPPAGKAYFEALGRRAKSQGYSSLSFGQMRQQWPRWARQAYARGWMMQGENND